MCDEVFIQIPKCMSNPRLLNPWGGGHKVPGSGKVTETFRRPLNLICTPVSFRNEFKKKQAELGVPHSRIQVEID